MEQIILKSADTLDYTGLTSINSREVTIERLEIKVSPNVRERVFREITHMMKVISRQYRAINYSHFCDVIQNQIVAYEAHHTISEASAREN